MTALPDTPMNRFHAMVVDLSEAGELPAVLLSAFLNGVTDAHAYRVIAKAYAELVPGGRHVGHGSALGASVVDDALRDVEAATSKARELGAGNWAVLGRVANGITGQVNGYRERAAARAMGAALDVVLATPADDLPGAPKPPARGRDTYVTRCCQPNYSRAVHAKCRGGWSAPSGWMACTCTCHEIKGSGR